VLEKGFIDRIVHRRDMHEEVARILEFFWRSTGGFAPVGRNLDVDAPQPMVSPSTPSLPRRNT
jgi:hypothetical protein